MEIYELFNKKTQSFIYNLQVKAVQRMLDFDHMCGRLVPSVAAIIHPTGQDSYRQFYFGTYEDGKPRTIFVSVYKSLEKAAEKHPDVDALISFASFRSAGKSIEETLGLDEIKAFEVAQIKTIVVIAEGIAERRMRELSLEAKKAGKVIIGPATVGGIRAGGFKTGNTAGTPENIGMSKLAQSGSVGFVSKSGGLSNECYNIIARNTDGVHTGVAIGGDTYPGSTLTDHLLRFEQNSEIKMLVCLGEVGGTDEYDICKALKDGRITKPLIVWTTGTCAKVFKTDVQFGHAGAKADAAMETADAKNIALREAGAVVPHSFDDYPNKIKQTYDRLVVDGVIVPVPEIKPPTIPMDYDKALKTGLIRKPTGFVTSITDERGQMLYYGDKSIVDVFEQDIGIGGVINELWFEGKLSGYACKFLEMVLMVVADHGPAVSGALNTIVATRAGVGIGPAISSGILTIGDRFGGAINGAAQMFSFGYDNEMSPTEFVKYWKKQGRNIQGIGHRVKSVNNPDARVVIVKEYAKQHFTETPLLDYALEVEQITTQKKDNLILNVDGCIAVVMVDLLRNELGKEKADEYIAMEILNGLFILGRSIGLIGHHIDQKRWKQPLHRHPWDDIAYMTRNQ